MWVQGSEVSRSRRDRSRQTVLATLRTEVEMTRADLAKATGLSRSAVAEAVQDLIRQSLIAEVEPAAYPGQFRRGRPAGMLTAAQPGGTVVGIDYGHAHLAVAVADMTGTVLAEERQTVDVDGRPAEALDLAAELVLRLLGVTGTDVSDVRGLAAGIPGPLDLGSHRILSPTIMSSWVGIDAQAELSCRLKRRVILGNDADLGALGEQRFGVARGIRDFVYVKVSHGIGAGFVLDGKPYRGSRGMAGEIGHTQLSGVTTPCRCGNRGCLESVVSLPRLIEQLRQLGIGSTNRADSQQSVLNAAIKNTAGARVVTDAGRTIGRVLADVANCLNPELIILGGELGDAAATLVLGVSESMNRYAQPSIAELVTITPSMLGPRAELMGAVAAAIAHGLLARSG